MKRLLTVHKGLGIVLACVCLVGCLAGCSTNMTAWSEVNGKEEKGIETGWFLRYSTAAEPLEGAESDVVRSETGFTASTTLTGKAKPPAEPGPG